jgi:hypothetical protein
LIGRPHAETTDDEDEDDDEHDFHAAWCRRAGMGDSFEEIVAQPLGSGNTAQVRLIHDIRKTVSRTARRGR